MLDFAVVEVTDQCNLRCKHCYDIFDGHHRITLEDEDMIIRNLKETKCKRVTLSGGEPLLIGENLFLFANKIKTQGIEVVMVTNGTLVEKYPPSFYRVFEHIQISLDGPEKIHEVIRGKGTYQKAIKAAEYLKAAEIKVSFQITINSMNQYSFYEVMEIAESQDVKLSVERVSHTGRAEEFEEIDYDNYKQILLSVMEKKLLTSDPLLNGFICEKYKFTPEKSMVKGCSAGRGGICISSKLNVYPCVRMRINCGNLNEDSLSNILDHTIYSKLGDRDALKGKCGKCQYKYICGGCRADAWLTTNDFFEEDRACYI